MTVPRYTLTARILHWLIALGIVAAFSVALYEGGMKFSPVKIALINYHKWIGIMVLGLAALRLIWRLTHPAPKPPAAMRKWEVGVAHGTHILLYILMFAVPLGGWLYSSAKDFPVVWLGLIRLPDPTWLVTFLTEMFHLSKKDLSDQLIKWHGIGAWIIVILAVFHMLAALKHHFISRDDVLRRML